MPPKIAVDLLGSSAAQHEQEQPGDEKPPMDGLHDRAGAIQTDQETGIDESRQHEDRDHSGGDEGEARERS